jgi:hypothetical protein
MTETIRLRFAERAYLRKSLFAIELLDAVTLERVSDGVTVTAEGLHGKPVKNSGGLFVWREEDLGPLTRITVDPGVRPYQPVERLKSELLLPPAPRPITAIELPPRADYQFAPGVTAVRGTLLEDRGTPPQPVIAAVVHLRWLDADGDWRDAPTAARTDDRGDFVAVLRLAPAEVPQLGAGKTVTVRLQARRNAAVRQSIDVSLPHGRVADSTTVSALTFAWNELQP